ncbi:MAG: hypothetical protein JXE06_08205 [Coriobacteriia bacterium]|nr:hypothetical protein [Coriobacteriia bacterium]MBN2821942.1 hypothetical protein [Coriobacteriia bacterium]
MAGKIFFRERRKVDEGEKKPRFNVVATQGTDLKFQVKHMRRQELEIIAESAGAELIELEVEEKGRKRESKDSE